MTPTGSLGEGEFDVVFDTCQDGVVDFEDEIFYEAITVEVPDGQAWCRSRPVTAVVPSCGRRTARPGRAARTRRCSDAARSTGR
ncbi:MAG TPA: hypothetical protein VEZ46_00935 [Mycobacteriales bacterium]|nr:hypothetical protein [Mycobacteriales bacterium]